MALPDQWAADQQRVKIDNDDAVTGKVLAYRPATLFVELDDGGTIEITEINRVKPITATTDDDRLQQTLAALKGGQAKAILAALDRAGFQITRKPGATGRTP